MTSASGGRNQVAHNCKVDWCHLVKTLEYQQTDLVLQTLLNGQPVQSISDVTSDVVVLPFVQYHTYIHTYIRILLKWHNVSRLPDHCTINKR